MLNTIKTLAVLVIFSLLGVEGILRAFDPLGVVIYDDFAAMRRMAVPVEHGYTLPSGEYLAAHWAYSVLADGVRLTPGRVGGGAVVTFAGDSVTFGYGVNDDEVWVSRVSSALRLNAVNTGRTAYSAVNVSRYLRGVTGCVVFLTFPNDPAHYDNLTDSNAVDHSSFTARTISLLQSGKPTVFPEPFNAGFEAAMSEIASRPDTLILAFDDPYGQAVAEAYDAVLIPWYTSRVSFADAHASAEGNQQIAEGATPVIEQWLSTRTCR